MNLKSDKIFLYITIVIFTTLIFSLLEEIKINVIIGIILGCIIVYFYNQKVEVDNSEILNKYNSLKIKPNFDIKYDNIITFLYDNQDLGNYNFEEYSNLITRLNEFIQIYEDILDMDPSNRNIQIYNLDILKNKQKEIVNIFHSIIYNLDESPNLITYFNNSLENLNIITNGYINYIFNKLNINKEDIPINNNTKLLEDLDSFEPYQPESTNYDMF